MNAPLRILISGQHGQVSQALQQRLQHLGELIVLGRDHLDLSQPESIRSVVRDVKPDLIINAAAHTAVDRLKASRNWRLPSTPCLRECLQRRPLHWAFR